MLSDPLGVVAQIRQIDRGIRSEKALLYSFLKSLNGCWLTVPFVFLRLQGSKNKLYLLSFVSLSEVAWRKAQSVPAPQNEVFCLCFLISSRHTSIPIVIKSCSRTGRYGRLKYLAFSLSKRAGRIVCYGRGGTERWK